MPCPKPCHSCLSSCRSCVRCCCAWGRPPQEESDSDEAEDDDGSWQDGDRGSRRTAVWLTEEELVSTKKKHKLTNGELHNLRAAVLEDLGGRAGREDEPPHISLQRRLGILQLRARVIARKMQVMQEPPAFPLARDLLSSARFEPVMGALIFVNAITIGLDTMYHEGEQKPTILALSEHLLTLCFVIEFILRIMAFSWAWIVDPYHFADAVIVWIPGVLANWILAPAGVHADILQRFTALRVLRLARLLRPVRMMPVFHELWVIVNGVMECSRLLFWAGVIMGATNFIFSITIIETITNSERLGGDPLVQESFGSLGLSMVTLVQLMTFDNWARIVRPIVFEAPETLLLFALFMGVAGIVIQNLITAIIVKNAFDTISNDQEAMDELKKFQHKKLQRELYDMFQEMDEDKSGQLSHEEFMDVLDDWMFIRKIKMLDIDIEELPDMFDILDDGDGEISIDEFCVGMTRMQGAAMSRDLMSATGKMTGINEQVGATTHYMAVLAPTSLDAVEDDLDQTSRNLVEMQVLTAEIFRCLNKDGLRRTLKLSMNVIPKVPEPDIARMVYNAKRCRRHPDRRRGAVSLEQGQEATQRVFLENSLRPLPPDWVFERQRHKREMSKQQALEDLDVGTREIPELVLEEVEDQPMFLPGVPQHVRDEVDSLHIKLRYTAPASALREAGGGPRSGAASPGSACCIALPGLARSLQVEEISSSF